MTFLRLRRATAEKMAARVGVALGQPSAIEHRDALLRKVAELQREMVGLETQFPRLRLRELDWRRPFAMTNQAKFVLIRQLRQQADFLRNNQHRLPYSERAWNDIYDR